LPGIAVLGADGVAADTIAGVIPTGTAPTIVIIVTGIIGVTADCYRRNFRAGAVRCAGFLFSPCRLTALGTIDRLMRTN
jgi:hypothetical protein